MASWPRSLRGGGGWGLLGRVRLGGGERGKMLFHADRSHARAAPAMRDAKCFVEIEMADIGAISARLRQAHLRVEVSAVEIDLCPVGMSDAANLANGRVAPSMRGWIRDHPHD